MQKGYSASYWMIDLFSAYFDCRIFIPTCSSLIRMRELYMHPFVRHRMSYDPGLLLEHPGVLPPLALALLLGYPGVQPLLTL